MIKSRKIKLRNNFRKFSPNSDSKSANENLSTPTSLANKSTSNYTDYAYNKYKKSSITSPDRLKLLKSTIRTNTAATDESVNAFLNSTVVNENIKSGYKDSPILEKSVGSKTIKDISKKVNYNLK